MKTEIISKHALIGRAPAELYMMFSDMRNFVQFLPADKREGIRADFDNIYANVQGFDLGVTVAARQPYSRIDFKTTAHRSRSRYRSFSVRHPRRIPPKPTSISSFPPN